jgi:acyl-CoA synthetase (NDP forming)
VISAGNQAVLGIEDFVDALVDDPRITAIGLYIEGLRDVAGFSRAAARALVKGVPIVALKAGTSDLGAQVALSHTSSLAGSDRLYRALFERLGIVRVDSIPALLETLKLFSVTGPVAGPRLRVLTCSGGESALTADLAEKVGLTFPAFTPEQVEDLRALLPVFATVANPLDYNTAIWGNAPALERCCTTAMSGACDAAMLVIDYPDPATADVSEWDTSVDAFVAGHKATGRPAVVTSTLSELLPRAVRERLAAAGVAPMQGLSEAVAALGAAVSHNRLRDAVLAEGGADALALPAPGASREDTPVLDEWTSKQRLADFGLAVPEGRLVSAAEATEAAAAIGFPVVVKAVGAHLAHKTEAGAVALNLESEEEVAAAVADIRANLGGGPQGHDRFMVERMVTGAVAELIVGVKRDPVFGLALVVGAGGILVELMGDAATLLLPTDRAAVLAGLAGLKGARLLTGYRGRPEGDLDAVADAALAVANFAEAHRDRLVELDVNPLLVLPAGQGVVAADALIRMAE